MCCDGRIQAVEVTEPPATVSPSFASFTSLLASSAQGSASASALHALAPSTSQHSVQSDVQRQVNQRLGRGSSTSPPPVLAGATARGRIPARMSSAASKPVVTAAVISISAPPDNDVGDSRLGRARSAVRLDSTSTTATTTQRLKRSSIHSLAMPALPHAPSSEGVDLAIQPGGSGSGGTEAAAQSGGRSRRGSSVDVRRGSAVDSRRIEQRRSSGHLGSFDPSTTVGPASNAHGSSSTSSTIAASGSVDGAGGRSQVTVLVLVCLHQRRGASARWRRAAVVAGQVKRMLQWCFAADVTTTGVASDKKSHRASSSGNVKATASSSSSSSAAAASSGNGSAGDASLLPLLFSREALSSLRRGSVQAPVVVVEPYIVGHAMPTIPRLAATQRWADL